MRTAELQHRAAGTDAVQGAPAGRDVPLGPPPVAKLVDLGVVPFDEASATAAHVPRLYEALQRCGLAPSTVDFRPLDADASNVAVGVDLGGARWELRVSGSRATSKRLNETPVQAALRHAKHVAAGCLLADAGFVAALGRAAAARLAAKEARAEALRAARMRLPTMTDLIVERFVGTGAYSLRAGGTLPEELAKVPAPACIGVDAEGFDVSRHDWKRAWLVQLAFRSWGAGCGGQGGGGPEGTVLVLLVKCDAEMDFIAEWMAEAARRDCRFYFFDQAEDVQGIFRAGSAPAALAERSADLKRFGPSLHALAGERLLGTEVRKHLRLCESMAYLPDTQGATEAQAAYAAADAIATLELGLRLLPPHGASVGSE